MACGTKTADFGSKLANLHVLQLNEELFFNAVLCNLTFIYKICNNQIHLWKKNCYLQYRNEMPCRNKCR